MCGRYSIHSSPDQLRMRFSTASPAPNFPPAYNAAPTQRLPIVRSDGAGGRTIELFGWGLVPHWSKDTKPAASCCNARGETVREKPMFRGAWRTGRRCIVPADHFYEWQKVDAKTKQPYAIGLAGGETFAMAGLWETKELEGAEQLRTFTIITTSTNELTSRVHDRMPVFLRPEDEALWLGDAGGEGDALYSLIRPFPAHLMKMWPVGLDVGNIRNQGSALAEPVGGEITVAA